VKKQGSPQKTRRTLTEYKRGWERRRKSSSSSSSSSRVAKGGSESNVDSSKK
jgi:hypothetical protein